MQLTIHLVLIGWLLVWSRDFLPSERTQRDRTARALRVRGWLSWTRYMLEQMDPAPISPALDFFAGTLAGKCIHPATLVHGCPLI